MAKLRAVLSADSRPLIRQAKKGAKALESMGKTGKAAAKDLSSSMKAAVSEIAGIGKIAAASAAALAAATGAVVAKSLSLAREQIKVERKLESVLKATGFAAGLSASELKNMASGLQDATNFGDELILGAQSMLLTFKSIGKDVFPQVTEMTLNMAEAFGTDLKSAAMTLGKALNDPIRGLTALGRVGVQFTDQQRDQIKAMVAVGDVAGAQKVILKELEGQIGGMARDLADPWIQFQNLIGDIGEGIGKGLIEPFKEFDGGSLFEVLKKTASEAEIAARKIGEVLAKVVGKFIDIGEEATKSGGLISAALDKAAQKTDEWSDEVAGAKTGFETLGDVMGGIGEVFALSVVASSAILDTLLSTVLAGIEKVAAGLSALARAAGADDTADSLEAARRAASSLSDEFGAAAESGALFAQELVESLKGVFADAQDIESEFDRVKRETQAAAAAARELANEVRAAKEEEDLLARAAEQTNRVLQEQGAFLAQSQAQATTAGVFFGGVSAGDFTPKGGNQTGSSGVPSSGLYSLERGEGVVTAEGMSHPLAKMIVEALNRPTVAFNGGINISGGGGDDLRAQARALYPELERLVSRGVQASLA